MDSIFDKITFRQIKTLIDVILAISGQNYEFIKKKYQSNAENFEETLAFFKGLKLINVENSEIIQTGHFNNFLNKHSLSDSLIKNYLLEKTLNTSNSFKGEVFGYLNNFKISRKAFEYRPTTERRLKASGIRNLFIELDLIQYDKANERYTITDKYFSIFANYAEKKKLTPGELSFLKKKQEELGQAAELEILKYEKQRLVNNPKLLRYLEHTSKSE